MLLGGPYTFPKKTIATFWIVRCDDCKRDSQTTHEPEHGAYLCRYCKGKRAGALGAALDELKEAIIRA